MSDPAFALVDYDNVVKNKSERTLTDVDENLELLCETLKTFLSKSLPTVIDIHLRLYGGWTDPNAQYTRRAQMLLTLLARHRRRRGTFRFNLSLVRSLACRSDLQLTGLLRLQSATYVQKMVDGLIIADAIHFAKSQSLPLILFSDDDDILPAAVSIRSIPESANDLHWIRKRLPGSAMNDGLLTRIGVKLSSI